MVKYSAIHTTTNFIIMFSRGLKDLKRKARAYYKSIKPIYCPYFSERVVFNSKGFKHLIYEDKGHQRTRSEQYLRLSLFPKGVRMLLIATVVQEYEERLVCNKIHKFWGFIGIIEGHKIKVVVRQIGDGKKHFYSIFPKWITRKSVEE